jgi:hypothetical protein
MLAEEKGKNPHCVKSDTRATEVELSADWSGNNIGGNAFDSCQSNQMS